MNIRQTKYSGNNFWSALIYHIPHSDGATMGEAVSLTYNETTSPFRFSANGIFWITWIQPGDLDTGVDIQLATPGTSLIGKDFNSEIVQIYDGTVDSPNLLSMPDPGFTHDTVDAISGPDSSYCILYTGGTLHFSEGTRYWAKLDSPVAGQNFFLQVKTD
jgi:hypothetical protein